MKSLLAALLTTSAMVSFAATASAQESVPDPAGGGNTTTVSPEQKNPAAAEAEGEIVVTGSRIARRDFESASPIVTVNQEAVANTGAVTLEAALNQFPQFVPAETSYSNALGASGQATLNLRGLGPVRNLVLLDGRRLQPASSTQVVDINTIPTILVGSTEVISGGASAVYGSDALSGVVNFKLRKLDGIEITAQNTITGRGDAGTREISVGAGTKFAGGRGSIIAGVSYTDRDALPVLSRAFYRRDRGNSSTLTDAEFSPGTNRPSRAAIDSYFAQFGAAPGSIPQTNVVGFNNDGTLFSSGAVTLNYRNNSPRVIDNGVTLLQAPRDLYARIPIERGSSFARATFEFSPDLTAYIQGMYTKYTSVTNQDAAPNAGYGTTVPVTNPYIPAAIRPLLASRPNPNAPFSLVKRYSEIGARVTDHDSTTYQALGGLSGRFGPDITWELYGSAGQSKLTDATAGSVFIDRVANLLFAPDGGSSICAGGYNPFFTTAALSQACKDYLAGTIKNRTKTSQQVVEGTVQGPITELPGGTLRFAVGADYRRNSFSFDPDRQLVTGNVTAVAQTSPTSGSTEAKEVYAELLVPVVRDLPLLNEVTLDLGYRYSDYRYSGGVSSYKADIDWTVARGLRLRGGYQRAIRAPNVGELFTASNGTFPSIGQVANGAGDPCDTRSRYRTGANAAAVRSLCIAQGLPAAIADTYTNNVAQIGAYTTGNPNLQPETADTFTAGVVIAPRGSPLLSGLSISVDYYNIKIKDAIAVLSSPISLTKCFNSDGSNPTYSASNVFCQQIIRNNVDGSINNALEPYFNIGGYRTDGIDVQADWSTAVSGDLRLGASVFVNYLNSFKVQQLSTSPFQEFAGSYALGNVLPRWRWNNSLTFGNKQVSALLRWRHIGKMQDASRVTNTASTIPGVKAFNYYDLVATANLPQDMTFRFGINNLLDRGPPDVGGIVGRTDASTYDVLGRTLFLAVTKRF